ncbi:hypothetical protein JCM10212_007097 [Sporobolomyces blumeae]
MSASLSTSNRSADAVARDPPDLSTLSAGQLKSLKSSILTEHFRFAPESFAKGGMDLANASMYAATAKVEQSLQRLVDERVEGWGDQEEQVQRGIYRLETLLEHSIDENFDLFEIYVLRNIFTFDNSLIPYLTLPHQATLDQSLQHADNDALAEYERELKLYEEEIEKRRQLKVVELFLREKAKRLDAVKEEIGWLSSGDRNPLSARSANLSPALSALHASLSALYSTPSPSLSLTASDGSRSKGKGKDTGGDARGENADDEPVLGPWAQSRSAFINWVAAKKTGAVGSSSGQRDKNAGGSGGSGGPQELVGSKDDAKALLGRLDA